MKMRLCFLFGMFLSAFVCADEKPYGTIVHIGIASFKDKPIYCEEEIVAPKVNDFEVLDYDIMSSEEGHRHSLLTIKNTSSGQRILTEQHLVAVYANCQSQNPIKFRARLSGGEIITKSIYFGIHQFPIIKIISKEEI